MDTFYILECLYEFGVRRLFVFLKENLNFDYLQDEFIKRKLILERDLKEYILTVPEYLRSGKFLKLIIERKRCQEFVSCMQEFPELQHIYERIREYKKNQASEGNAMNVKAIGSNSFFFIHCETLIYFLGGWGGVVVLVGFNLCYYLIFFASQFFWVFLHFVSIKVWVFFCFFVCMCVCCCWFI